MLAGFHNVGLQEELWRKHKGDNRDHEESIYRYNCASGNPEFPLDIDRFVEAANEYNILIEINNSSFTVSRKGSRENCIKIAKKAASIGAKIAVGSDAHICFDVGNFEYARRAIEEAGVSEQNVINTSMQKVVDF